MTRMTRTFGMMCLAVWLSTAFVAEASFGSHKAADLSRKMNEIKSLQSQLAQKTEQALRLRAQLIAKKRELIDEIRDEHERHGYASFQEAVGNSRIDFNLELVQRIGIYTASLSDRIDFFMTGAEKMTYLYRQAEDDLKMVQTLDDMQIDELMSLINRSLTSYRIEIEKKLINFRRAEPESERAIWESVMAGN